MLYFDGWTRTSEIEAFLFLFSVDFLCFLFSLSLLFCSLFHASFHVCFGFFFLQYFHLILRFGIFICLGFWIDVCVLSNVYAFWHCFVIVGCRRIKKNIIYGKIRFFTCHSYRKKYHPNIFASFNFKSSTIWSWYRNMWINYAWISIVLPWLLFKHRWFSHISQLFLLHPVVY